MRLFAALMLCLALVLPARAATTDQGTPNTVLAPGPLGACGFFQVGNLNQWFAVPTTDINFEDEFALLSLGFILSTPVTFTDAGTTVASCQGYELAQNIQLGNTQCSTGYLFDFSVVTGCDFVALLYR
jgi:hypothetical protein